MAQSAACLGCSAAAVRYRSSPVNVRKRLTGGDIISGECESFFVGGRYVDLAGERRMAGQAYVQRRSPEREARSFPLVMIHGGHQTAVNFETAPDGRAGWADYFTGAGFTVYLMDQPGRGRSPYLEEEYGPAERPHDTIRIEQRFTAPEAFELWPQARLHTQWPGTGRAGDPEFDQFYASQAPSIDDPSLRERLMRDAGAALLDRIGPAILLTHSQSGHFGWQIGDARPELVKAIITIEPAGPPFFEVQTVGAPEYFCDGRLLRPYGLTATAIAYDPPVIDPAVDLPFIHQAAPDAPDKVCCYLQQEPPRKLVNLVRIPVAVVTGEASFHAGYDHCVVKYLRQGGVEVSHIRLAEEGIHGNGHMMMLEKNSDAIAARLCRWIEEYGLAG